MKNKKPGPIKDLLDKLGINDGDIAEIFGYSSEHSYDMSRKAKPRLEKGLLKFYELIERIQNPMP